VIDLIVNTYTLFY